MGGNSLSVSGAALTVAENTRIFLIGTTEPSVVGGSATYTTPNTVIRQRDDDAADLYTNSMITSNSDGLIQFFGGPAYFDCIIQDGNQANQGSLIDLPVGAVEGISTNSASVFGVTVTFNGPTIFNDTMDSAAPLYLHRANAALAVLGVTGVATFNSRVQFGASFAVNGAIGVTGPATFGTTVTLQGNISGISSSGVAVFGQTVTLLAGLTASRAFFGQTVTLGTTLSSVGITNTGSFVTSGAIGMTGVISRISDVHRNRCIQNGFPTLTVNSTTPAVSTATLWRENNTVGTSITNFTSGSAGQEITIVFGSGNTWVLNDNINVHLAGSTHFVGTANFDTLTLVFDGSVWYEKSRSVN